MAWLHTEVVDSIGPLEMILNTPSHHRVHHSRNPEYIDKNYGGMLIIWDRLFKTFKSEDKLNPPVYGLVSPVRSFNPIRVQFHPWPILWRRVKAANSIRNKLGVIFCGPGWQPGKPRLGEPGKLPKIKHPVNCYDPVIGFWKNCYVVIHFGMILLFYHELTLSQNQFSIPIINIGVLSLILSITSIGLMLDNKHSYSSALELFRCFMFFYFRQYLLSIVDHCSNRLGIPVELRIECLRLIYLVFGVSLALNSFQIFKKLVFLKLWQRYSLAKIKKLPLYE